MTSLTLLSDSGETRQVELGAAPGFTKPTGPLRSRVAYAAAHVVPLPWADNTPGSPAQIDWDATLAYRHHLWSWGLGVADAMDTAQRNMGLDAKATRELIVRSSREAASVGGAIVVGVNTDQVDEENISLSRIIDAYAEQLQVAEDAGAVAVLMASRHLARAAASAEGESGGRGPAEVYKHVYREVLKRAGAPVVLHWLGEAFDPVLSGYFGSHDWREASKTVIDIIEENDGLVSGIKMSLLNVESEVSVRARLPLSAQMFTGDDFNYVGLIAGDGERYSNALLGAFTAIGQHASAAIQALDAGDSAEYQRILAPTEALSRQIFAAPTYYYKTGIAFLSWLNGHQAAFSMVGGLHSARNLPHLSEIVRLANECGALEQPELAAARWHAMLQLNGLQLNGVAR